MRRLLLLVLLRGTLGTAPLPNPTWKSVTCPVLCTGRGALVLSSTVSSDFSIAVKLNTKDTGGVVGAASGGLGIIDAGSEYSLSLGAGRVLFGAGGVTVVGGDSLADGTWHTIVAVRQDSTQLLTLYVDGLEAGRKFGSGAVDAKKMAVCGHLGGASFLSGLLAGVEIYDSALTVPQVQAITESSLCPAARNTPTPAPSTPPTSPPAAPSAPPTSPPAFPTAPPAPPSARPTASPRRSPSAVPSTTPTTHPSRPPTHTPTNGPAATPTKAPSADPTRRPIAEPTAAPLAGTAPPTSPPRPHPSASPTAGPTGYELPAVASAAARDMAFAAAGAAPGPALAVAIVSSAGCDDLEEVPFALHPTRGRIGGSLHRGCVVFNGVLMLSVALLHFTAVSVYRLVTKQALKEASAKMRFPGLSLAVVAFLSQGVMFSSVRLVASEEVGAWRVLATFSIFAVIHFVLWLSKLLGTVGDTATPVYDSEAVKARVQWLVGRRAWVTSRPEYTVERYGTLFKGFRIGCTRFFACEVALNLVLGTLTAMGSSCAWTRMSMTAVASVFVVAILLVRPYLRGRDSMLLLAVALLTCTILALQTVIAFGSRGVVEDLAAGLTTLAATLLACKALLDILMVVWNVRTKRTERLQVLLSPKVSASSPAPSPPSSAHSQALVAPLASQLFSVELLDDTFSGRSMQSGRGRKSSSIDRSRRRRSSANPKGVRNRSPSESKRPSEAGARSVEFMSLGRGMSVDSLPLFRCVSFTPGDDATQPSVRTRRVVRRRPDGRRTSATTPPPRRAATMHSRDVQRSASVDGRRRASGPGESQPLSTEDASGSSDSDVVMLTAD